MKRFLVLPVLGAFFLGAAVTTGLDYMPVYFTDEVDFEDWYHESAHKMYAHGLMSGYEDGSFGGSNAVTRAELAVILDRYSDSIVDVDLSNREYACTEEARGSLLLYIYDQNGDAVEGANFLVDGSVDGSFVESQPGLYGGLEESDGYYTLTIQKEGYVDHVQTFVFEQDFCHVIGQTHTITLISE